MGDHVRVGDWVEIGRTTADVARYGLVLEIFDENRIGIGFQSGLQPAKYEFVWDKEAWRRSEGTGSYLSTEDAARVMRGPQTR